MYVYTVHAVFQAIDSDTLAQFVTRNWLCGRTSSLTTGHTPFAQLLADGVYRNSKQNLHLFVRFITPNITLNYNHLHSKKPQKKCIFSSKEKHFLLDAIKFISYILMVLLYHVTNHKSLFLIALKAISFFYHMALIFHDVSIAEVGLHLLFQRVLLQIKTFRPQSFAIPFYFDDRFFSNVHCTYG